MTNHQKGKTTTARNISERIGDYRFISSPAGRELVGIAKTYRGRYKAMIAVAVAEFIAIAALVELYFKSL